MTQTTRDKLIDRAEQYIRSGGFASFSFRDLASDLGIKSASVHYHFATKADLGEEVARRYNLRFQQALPNPNKQTTESLMRDYFLMFHREMKRSKQVCLCAALSTERPVLPTVMAKNLTEFYDINLQWLRSVLLNSGKHHFTKTQANQKASQILATLQGALIGAFALKNSDYFEHAACALYRDLFKKEIRLPK